MKKCLVMAGAVLGLSASGMRAQGGGLSQPQCTAGTPLSQQTIAQDACQQAYDVYQFMAPQLGLALAGGNATLGQGGTLGGLGHFSVGLRGNVFNGKVPQVDKMSQSPTGARQSSLPTSDQVVGLPTADAEIGIFKGLPLALTNVGGLDVLVSAAYIPSIDDNGLSVTPNNNWQFGWGARLGLLSESIITPGISVTWIERDLPETSIRGSSNGYQLNIDNLKVKTSAWRVVASKSFIVFGLAGGVGQDRYDQSAQISASTQNALCPGGTCAAGVPNTAQQLTRLNMFGDFSFNLPLFKIVAEIGQASGGTVNTYNSFSGGRADQSQLYGSLGVRLTW